MVMAKVNLAVSDDYLDHFSAVVGEAQKVGLHVEQELAELGIVSGSIDIAKLGALDRVTGISAVEEERTFQLPPPDSLVQ